jgi:hypothetical protein
MRKATSYLILVSALLIPQIIIAETVFHHTAENSPFLGSSPNDSPYLWHEGQSLVTRSQDVKKSGSWSLKHQATTPSTEAPQTGKVGKWIAPWLTQASPIQNNTMYISNWYYFSSNGGFSIDPKNWENWKNHYEF